MMTFWVTGCGMCLFLQINERENEECDTVRNPLLMCRGSRTWRREEGGGSSATNALATGRGPNGAGEEAYVVESGNFRIELQEFFDGG